MVLSLWNSWAEEWVFDDKVCFNGVTREIYVFPGVAVIDIKADVYSAWVRWLSINENARFLHAMRYIGGDPIGEGQYTAEIFFLMNDWQIVVDHNIQANGIIFHDDGIRVFDVLPGGGVINKVAALAYAYSAAVPDVTVDIDTSAIASAVWNHTQ